MELSQALKILGMKKFKPNMDVQESRLEADKTYQESSALLGTGRKKETPQQLETMQQNFQILKAWEALCEEQKLYNPCPVCNKLIKKKHNHCPECGKIVNVKKYTQGENVVIKRYECSSCGNVDVKIID